MTSSLIVKVGPSIPQKKDFTLLRVIGINFKSFSTFLTLFLKMKLDHRFCVAPMMDCTDRHCRYLYRLLSKRAILYTEMVTSSAIIHGQHERHLKYSSFEHPLALQLGGSDPDKLARCAEIAEKYEYDEINLNVGCPSDRVQAGKIGVCLMLEPDLVAHCVRAMQAVTGIPITVKTRIGVDEQDSYEFLATFINKVTDAGCKTFIIHARKAWLKGLSPAENRRVPPLMYERIEQLKNDFPYLEIVLNGGLKTIESCIEWNAGCEGVMLGRGVYENPYILSQVDSQIYGENTPVPSRQDVIDKYVDYAKNQHQEGVPISFLVKPLQDIYAGVSGAKRWRQTLADVQMTLTKDKTSLYIWDKISEIVKSIH